MSTPKPSNSHENAHQLETTQKKRSLTSRLLLALIIAGALVIVTECVLRFGMGLGDPPLYTLDPEIEYYLTPSRTYARFGNTYAVNAHSMRSPEFPSKKSDANELRVLIVGDSIVNGGGKIDQPQLASELLQAHLAKALQRPVVVGNASAGSWGPENELAFIKRFGLFDADVVILELNSEDEADVPGNEFIGPQWPQRTPKLALQEIVERFAPRIYEKITGKSYFPLPAHTPDLPADRARCIEAVKHFITTVQQTGARPILLAYRKKNELGSSVPTGLTPFNTLATDLGCSVIDNAAAFSALIASGKDPYLPNEGTHASAAGQQALSDVLADAVIGQIKPKTGPNSPARP